MNLHPRVKPCLSIAALIVVGLASTNAAPASDITTRYPGVRVCRQGSRVLSIFGRPMTAGERPQDAVENWLTENAAALGVPNLDIRLTRSGLVGRGLLYVFTYQQFIDGIPVENGVAKILVHTGPPNRVVYVGARLVQPPADGFQPDTINGAQALTNVRALPDYAALPDWSTPEMVMFYDRGNGELITPVRAWKFLGRQDQVGAHEAYTFLVDAGSDGLVHVRNEVHHADLTGRVTGWGTPGTAPDTASNTPEQMDLKDLLVQVVGGNSAYTGDVPGGENGEYAIEEAGAPPPVTLAVDLLGRWVTVQNAQGDELHLEQQLTPPGTADFQFNPPPHSYPDQEREFNTAQVNCYIHATRTHDFYKERQPGCECLTGPVMCSVNDPDPRYICNAGNVGDTITFYAARPESGCPNTSYSSMIAHEYGHVIVDQLGIQGAALGGGFGEGFGDSVAILVYNDPVVGYGIQGSGTLPRNIETADIQYPCQGSIHECGQLLAGIWWDIKLNLVQKYIDDYPNYTAADCPITEFPVPNAQRCGLEVTRQLFTDWSRDTLGALDGQSAHPQTAEEVLTADDDDGDLSNKTPHYSEICAAFNAHSIWCPFDAYPPGPEPGGPSCSVDDDCTNAGARWAGAVCVGCTCYVPRNRYLSIDPTPNADPVAYRVTVTEASKKVCSVTLFQQCTVDGDCPTGETCIYKYNQSVIGTTWWVCAGKVCSSTSSQECTVDADCPQGETCVYDNDGAPRCLDYTGQECPADSPGPHPVPCSVPDSVPISDCSAIDANGNEWMFGWRCNLGLKGGTAPPARLWTESPVHIGACVIAPVITYEIEASADGGVTFSSPLEIMTIRQPDKDWGDMTGGAVGGGDWSPPNGTTNMTDVQGVIAVFEQWSSGYMPVCWADLAMDQKVDMSDVQQAIFAFQQPSGMETYAVIPSQTPPSACLGRGEGDGTQGDGMEDGGTSATFTLVPSAELIDPWDLVNVDVFIDYVADLGAYQVALDVTGGDAGSLDLEDLTIDTNREDYVFGSDPIMPAIDMNGGRLGAVRLNGGIEVTGPAYLARFSYRASADASGVFTVSLRENGDTFLNDSFGGEVASSAGDPASIGVDIECFLVEHCDDINDCTADACVSYACQNDLEPSGTPCDDGLFCTAIDECDGNGTCVGRGNPCPRPQICNERMDVCIGGSGE